MTKTLDVITLGRASVDLYGDQVGGRLEDMSSFSKYIGGSPTNIACGAARLDLKSAVTTGVGDEHMGPFIVEQLRREGVDTRGVKVDPARLTALVILGIRDRAQFPLIFFRENCADMGLTEDDIDEGFVRPARALVVTGTHLSHASTKAAALKALALGLDGPVDELAASFALAAQFELVKGFAVGRTVFGAVARNWLAGRTSDGEAVARMTATFAQLCRVWDEARAANKEEVA